MNRNEPNSYRDTTSTYLAKESDRGLGDIEFFKHRAISSFSRASSEAARNLLHKAQRALDDDDTERARAYVTRAVQLPFDEAEEVPPVAWEAHMLLFTAVTDALEESDEDDTALARRRPRRAGERGSGWPVSPGLRAVRRSR